MHRHLDAPRHVQQTRQSERQSEDNHATKTRPHTQTNAAQRKKTLELPHLKIIFLAQGRHCSIKVLCPQSLDLPQQLFTQPTLSPPGCYSVTTALAPYGRRYSSPSDSTIPTEYSPRAWGYLQTHTAARRTSSDATQQRTLFLTKHSFHSKKTPTHLPLTT